MDLRQLLEVAYLTKNEQILQFLKANYPRLHFAMFNHVNIRGEAMTFHDKPYLAELYKDDCPRISVKSSVQTGKSEWLIVSVHSWAERGLQMMYVLPTIEVRNKFVGNRVDVLYERMPYYQKLVQNKNSTGLKRFGAGAIYWEGSNSANTFIEKPLDGIIADETDRFDVRNYEKADDRLTASPWKLKYEASNPTVDKYGIDGSWRQSDQRSWFVQCTSCNFWQTIDWFKNVVRQTNDSSYELIDSEWREENKGTDPACFCVRCGSVLNRYDIKGQWVSKIPKKTGDWHGYHIHQMISPFVKIREMWMKFGLALMDDTKMQVFYNSQLGLTYAGVGSKLTDELLNACKENYLMPIQDDNPCFMGVDVGKVLHVKIFAAIPGGRQRLVFAGTVKDFEDLDWLFGRFNIVSYVIDAMPETRKATEYAQKHVGRGWICRYNQGLMELTANDDTRVVSVDRTMIMDRVMNWYMTKKYILPQNAQSIDKGQVYEQLKNPTRVKDDEKNRYDWLGSEDHYYHANVYALVAYLARGEFATMAVDLRGGDPLQQAAAAAEKIPNTFEEVAIQFPPGTPQSIIDHYRNLYNQAKKSSKID